MNVIPRISDQVLGDQAVSCFFFTKPAWLLAKRIFSIVTNNRENQWNELKEHLVDIHHPEHILVYNSIKYFS